MALIKCIECGKEHSDTANSCPNCGFIFKKEKNVSNKKTGKGCLFFLAIIIFIFISYFVSNTSSKNTSSNISNAQQVSKEFYFGDTVYVGNLGYCVLKTRRTDEIAYQKADSSFLIIDLSVKNNDKKARTILSFKLIDQDGREYDVSGNGMFLENDLSFLKTINPGVQTDGHIVFDVPKDNTYKLIVQGEFGSGIEAIINLKKSSEERNAKAQYDLGVMYYKGEGVEKDDKKAFEWYIKSANQGHAKAQFNLGCMYYKGEGVEKDDKKAIELFTKSAEQGFADAQFNLGQMYNKGLGVEKDYKKAFEWYTKSAEEGFAQAQYNLGCMYYNGEGVEKNDKKAIELFTKSAEQGNDFAKKTLQDISHNKND